MSEVQSRPAAPRGRGSARGGRGGFSARGGRGGPRPTSGEKSGTPPTSTYEDEGEVGKLKRQYASKLSTIKEMFPDWTDEDIVFALQETDGDLEGTIEQITEGHISQWGEVKKNKKDRARSKTKDTPTVTTDATAAPSRSGRGRGSSDGPRGSRGRGGERGRGAGRSARSGVISNGGGGHEKVPITSGHETSALTGTVDSSSVSDIPPDQPGSTGDQSRQGGASSPDASWELVTPIDNASPPATEAARPSSKPVSWATLFAKQTPAAPLARAKVSPPLAAKEPVVETSTPVEEEQEPADEPSLPPPAPVEETSIERPSTPGSSEIPSAEQEPNITPSKDALTETNLEQVLDTSGPPPTTTAASTVASTIDPRSAAASTTPVHGAQQQQAALRPGLGGYATSAYKATAGSGRSSSFQRRVMEQQEAVVMPGNHAVDRAAVQFGSMGLNGTAEDLDVDDDREDAETRPQPPQHSPVAPRAALPPPPPQSTTESIPTPRQAPGLPPAAPQSHAQSLPQAAQPEQAPPTAPAQASYPYHQFNNRYGPPTSQQDSTGPAQKAYEPFGQQIQQPTTQQQLYESYAPQAPTPSTIQQQQPSQSHLGNISSAATDYSSYYTSDSQRNAYPNYYGSSYGQPSQSSQPDTNTSQQRVGSGFGSSAPEQTQQHITAQNPQPPQARYGSLPENQNSGHSTPNPALGPQAQIPTQQSHQIPPQQHPAQPGGQHMYGFPYSFNNPYYSHLNQFGYGGGQGGYGAGPYGAASSKQGMYGQPHQAYGMSPQSTYDHHSASPGNVGGYGQQSHSLPSREAAGSGLGSYARTGSAQATDGQQQHSGGIGAFGGGPDVFGRGQGVYPGQAQSLSQQGTGQQGGNEESTRGYGDPSKIAGGPSPAAGQAAGRPGSATNAMQGQANLPSQAPGQHNYNSYQSLNPQMHGQQASQYGAGLGNLGGHHQSGAQAHQASGYGGGYGSAFGGNYYGNNNRGGWGGNYGH